MPSTTPESLPELVTRKQALEALAALGVTDTAGVHGFEATLHDVTFRVHLHAKNGGPSGGSAKITVPIVGSGS